MRRPEQKLWDTMLRNKPGNVILERNENVVVVGAPDVYSLKIKHTVWIELKIGKVPKRPTTKMQWSNGGLSQDQMNWIARAVRRSIPVYILARDDNKELYLLGGEVGDIFNSMTRDQCRALRIADNWNKIFEVVG